MRFHPILHYTRLHAGVDLSAGSGTPIRAAADGVVVVAGDRGGYGTCTVIDHGSGLATVYAHQSSVAVQAGQLVKLGDVIGRVGTTGLSTGPHLHFETRLRGVPVSPTNFVSF
ncbi:MAG: M23 family metallopeptidase [Acidimicrobiales bacterium]